MCDADQDERTYRQQQRNRVIKEAEMKPVKMLGNTNERKTRYGKFGFTIDLPKHERDMWEEIVNEQDEDRSALIRAFAAVGRRCVQEHDPLKENSAGPTATEELIKQNVPKKRSSAATVSDIIDSIVEDMGQIVMQTLAEDSQIQQNGKRFYRVQE